MMAVTLEMSVKSGERVEESSPKMKITAKEDLEMMWLLDYCWCVHFPVDRAWPGRSTTSKSTALKSAL